MHNTNMRTLLLTDLFDGIRATLRMNPLAIDCSLEVTDQRLVCNINNPTECALDLHAQPIGEQTIRIVAKEANKTAIGFTCISIYLPYDRHCELSVGELCQPMRRNEDWLKIGSDIMWAPVRQVPQPAPEEWDEKQDGTVWNHRGTLFLFHNGKHYNKCHPGLL